MQSCIPWSSIQQPWTLGFQPFASVDANPDLFLQSLPQSNTHTNIYIYTYIYIYKYVRFNLSVNSAITDTNVGYIVDIVVFVSCICIPIILYEKKAFPSQTHGFYLGYVFPKLTLMSQKLSDFFPNRNQINKHHHPTIPVRPGEFILSTFSTFFIHLKSVNQKNLMPMEFDSTAILRNLKSLEF